MILECGGGYTLSTSGEFLLHELLVLVNSTLNTSYIQVTTDPDLGADQSDEAFIVRYQHHSALRQ